MTTLLLGAGPGVRSAGGGGGGTFEVNPTVGSGYVESASEVAAATAYTGVGSTKIVATGGRSFLGQFTDTEQPVYVAYETFLNFSLSGVTGSTVSSAVFSTGFANNGADVPFTMEFRENNWGDTLTTADYISNLSLGTPTLLASRSTSGLNTTTYFAFTESGTALRDAVQAALGGTLRVLMNSSEHRLGNDPGGNSSVTLEAYNSVNRKPKLVIITT